MGTLQTLTEYMVCLLGLKYPIHKFLKKLKHFNVIDRCVAHNKHGYHTVSCCYQRDISKLVQSASKYGNNHTIN